eukprot:495551-Amphidinium_carterae.1
MWTIALDLGPQLHVHVFPSSKALFNGVLPDSAHTRNQTDPQQVRNIIPLPQKIAKIQNSQFRRLPIPSFWPSRKEIVRLPAKQLEG